MNQYDRYKKDHQRLEEAAEKAREYLDATVSTLKQGNSRPAFKMTIEFYVDEDHKWFVGLIQPHYPSPLEDEEQ